MEKGYQHRNESALEIPGRFRAVYALSLLNIKSSFYVEMFKRFFYTKILATPLATHQGEAKPFP